MNAPTTLGQLIRSCRNAAGLTQPQAAAAAAVSVGTWSRVERDRLTPEPRYLAAIAHAVNCTPDALDELGLADAADLLRARLGQADGNQRHHAPNSIVAAITLFQMAALDIGWSVGIRHPDKNTYLIELRRDKIPTVVLAEGNPATTSTR